MKQFLKQEILRGNKTNLGRSIPSDMVATIIDQTSFLQAPKNFNERVYCILHDITKQPLNIYGKNATFINITRGYSYGVVSATENLRAELALLKKRSARLKRAMAANLKCNSTGLSKASEFCKRNRSRNSSLYKENLIKGKDYVLCPVTGARMLVISDRHASHVLGMSTAEFDHLYPNSRGSCQARVDNIKTAINEIDASTGHSKHQGGVVKAHQSRLQADHSGETVYQRIGRKTRATHMANVDERGKNGYQRQVQHRLTTVLDNGLTVEQNAHIKRKLTLANLPVSRKNAASKISKKVLAPIITLLEEHNIDYYFDTGEYAILDSNSGNYYLFDLTIPKFSMAIEYQSRAWHACPFMTEEEWKNWRTPKGKKRIADDVFRYDCEKAKSLYKLRNYVTYYVWEKTRDQDVEDLICLLKTQITK